MADLGVQLLYVSSKKTLFAKIGGRPDMVFGLLTPVNCFLYKHLNQFSHFTIPSPRYKHCACNSAPPPFQLCHLPPAPSSRALATPGLLHQVLVLGAQNDKDKTITSSLVRKSRKGVWSGDPRPCRELKGCVFPKIIC